MGEIERRTVLGAGGVIAAGLLAGCTSESPEQQRPPKQQGPATVKKTDVPVGSGLVLADHNFVVTQPAAGQFVAFVKICPHAGCAVAMQGSIIHCPCHGSEFAVADGHVTHGPAQAGLSKATVKDNGDGTLTVAG